MAQHELWYLTSSFFKESSDYIENISILFERVSQQLTENLQESTKHIYKHKIKNLWTRLSQSKINELNSRIGINHLMNAYTIDIINATRDQYNNLFDSPIEDLLLYELSQWFKEYLSLQQDSFFQQIQYKIEMKWEIYLYDKFLKDMIRTTDPIKFQTQFIDFLLWQEGTKKFSNDEYLRIQRFIKDYIQHIILPHIDMYIQRIIFSRNNVRDELEKLKEDILKL